MVFAASCLFLEAGPPTARSKLRLPQSGAKAPHSRLRPDFRALPLLSTAPLGAHFARTMNPEDSQHDHPPVGTMEPPKPAAAPARPAPNVSPVRKPAATISPNSGRGFDDDDDAPKGFKRFRMPIIIGVLAITGIVVAQRVLSTATNSPPPKQDVQEVHIMMPPPSTPPPPPPPPPQEVKQEEKMVVEEKQEEQQPDPTPQIQTALKATGAGGGLSGLGVGKGNGVFANRNGMSSEKMRWSAYSNAAGNQILAALRTNPATKKSVFRNEIRFWVDAAGRITRAVLVGTTGDPKLDATIRDEILVGRQLMEPPPEGMQMPIVMRAAGRRPN